ncbi:MAG: pilus assembly protein CpaF, partial [Acidimicrobiaceae bacterium]
MNSSTLLAALLVGGGFALLVVGMLSRVYAREEQLADILDLPYGEQDVDIAGITEQHGALVENLSGIAGRWVDSLDER